MADVSIYVERVDLEPNASVTIPGGYGLMVPGEYVLDSGIELTVGDTSGLTEVLIL